MNSRIRTVVAATAGLMVGVCAVPAGAASILEKNFWLSGPRYDGVLPPCEAALDRIQHEFGTKERRFWNSDLEILEFDRVHEIAFRPWAPSTIPRRFCGAIATTSDSRHRAVYYSIGEDVGFVGFSWGVEWCVVGLDRNWAYNPGCKMARP
jgi:hypothetical protein